MNLETIAANSYRNFHAKGLDYLCLHRSDSLTRKVYFFDGDMTKLPEIVMPHNHRYRFRTWVLAGQVSNRFYAEGVRGACERFERFDYMTPLNGGDGFTWRETTTLRVTSEWTYQPGQTYLCEAWEIHTLQIRADQSVIMLDQYEDVVPLDKPTRAFKKDGRAPDLAGLYERMPLDHLKLRLTQAHELLKGCFA